MKSFSTYYSLAMLLLLTACNSSPSPVSVRTVIDRSVESEQLGGPVITIVQPGD